MRAASSIRECLDAVFPAIPHCLDLIGAAYLKHHPDVIQVF
jgi:molybdopterin adenylyltransferase